MTDRLRCAFRAVVQRYWNKVHVRLVIRATHFRRRAGWVLSVCALAFGTTAAAATGERDLGAEVGRDTYAVVIGISKYQDRHIAPVPYAVADAQELADVLMTTARVPKGHVLVLTDASATRQAILHSVEQWLPRQTSSGARVIVYYAGVGTVHPERGDAALIPWDGQLDQPERLLTVKALYSALTLSGADHVLVLLDTCFVGSIGRCSRSGTARSPPGPSFNPDWLTPEGRIVAFLASNGKEPSLDYERVKHGLFTYYLLNGLQGEADADRNGLVTLNEAFQYTREQVSETAWGHYFRLQTPTLLRTQTSSSAEDDLILVRADRNTLAHRHLAVGRGLHEKGDLEGAIAEYRTAVRLLPDDAASHLRLGLALRDKGDVEGAIVSYRMTLHLRPNDPDAHYLLGTAYSDKGQLEAAIEEFRQAIRLKPGFDVAHNNLGHVLEQKGDLHGAIVEYRTAAKLQPEDARAHYNLGSALKDKGDLEGAVKELREAIKLKPDYAKAHYHLGLALATLGRRQESARALRKFVQLSPVTPSSRDMVQDAKERIKALE